MSDTSDPCRELFPTLLYQGRLDTSLVASLETACWMMEEADKAGHDWCEQHGYPGYTSYASLDDLPHRHPAFADLLSCLDQQAADFADRLDWALGSAQLVCDSLWVNILAEDGYHSGHIHPQSVISGTCYISMPEGAGALKLEDPRLALMMASPALREGAKHPRFNYVQPETGTVLMWESWLRHEVMPNRSEEARLSVSFNYALKDT